MNDVFAYSAPGGVLLSESFARTGLQRLWLQGRLVRTSDLPIPRAARQSPRHLRSKEHEGRRKGNLITCRNPSPGGVSCSCWDFAAADEIARLESSMSGQSVIKTSMAPCFPSVVSPVNKTALASSESCAATSFLRRIGFIKNSFLSSWLLGCCHSHTEGSGGRTSARLHASPLPGDCGEPDLTAGETALFWPARHVKRFET